METPLETPLLPSVDESGIDTSMGVSSEVEPLRRVLMHRPGPEIEVITPDNRRDYLFDELLWPRRAREEHDDFSRTLRAQGVEVLDVGEQLENLCSIPNVRGKLTTGLTRDLRLPRREQRWVHDWLDDVPAPVLIGYATGGIRRTDVPEPATWPWRPGEHEADILPPLPNQMFTRDSSFLVRGHAVVSTMREPARHRESTLLEVLYNHHPSLRSPLRSVTTRPRLGNATLEGGDVLVCSPEAVAVGIGPRTSVTALVSLVDELTEAGYAPRWVLAVALPEQRASMHLDTLLTFVDRSTVLASPRLHGYSVYLARPGGEGLRISEVPSLQEGLKRCLDSDVRVLEPPLDGHIREQWDDGCNVLALAPGTVIGYESNERTNEFLGREGMEVITLRGSELRRARGGPRCLTCPLLRQQ